MKSCPTPVSRFPGRETFAAAENGALKLVFPGFSKNSPLLRISELLLSPLTLSSIVEALSGSAFALLWPPFLDIEVGKKTYFPRASGSWIQHFQME